MMVDIKEAQETTAQLELAATVILVSCFVVIDIFDFPSLMHFNVKENE